eukprot:Phypoly_transcript_19977.p1 GENE.Phypoly_transcript_19977~~Phypoly_transcript_19977.p1  ORF type:complete len:176 (+),score=30.88 Phypoly_transcript_19977:72-599(+)
MLSITNRAFDKENIATPSGKTYGSTPSQTKAPTRKALGEITNTTPARKVLGEITNKQSTSQVPQKTVQKAPAPIVKVKKATKPKAKVQEVPDVERMYPFKFNPMPDLEGLDFDVDRFLVPMVNIPYSLEYAAEIHTEVVIPEEFGFDFTEELSMGRTFQHISLDDPSLTEDVLII